ncbi:cysteine desulfurase IscS [Planctomycetota bacterium]|nr:cysteine desulfurase IscS [Planctomycetota bacterium]
MPDADGWIDADHNATTPCLPEVVEAVVRCLRDDTANPGNRSHPAGRRAQAIVDAGRAEVAALIGADPAEIIFTSGATEACNLAILGVAERAITQRPGFVAPATEHSAVLEPIRRLSDHGAAVRVLPVDAAGQVTAERFAAALDDRTALAAAMLVNNETGLIHPIADFAALCKQHGALLLCDATQAPGRLAIDVGRLGCDLLTLSAHKLYGPKGIGALWLRRGLALSPQIVGGGQERGMRSGTPNVPGITGFAVAARLAREQLASRQARLAQLTHRLEARLLAALPGLRIHAADAERAPGTTMISLPGLPRGWLTGLQRTRASGGSACQQSTGRPSHVLLALGLSEADAGNSLRLGLGIQQSEADVEAIAADVTRAALALRGSDRTGGGTRKK